VGSVEDFMPWRHVEIPAHNTFAREVRGLPCKLSSPPRCPSHRFHFPHPPDIDSLWLKPSRLSLYFPLAFQLGKEHIQQIVIPIWSVHL
jgi:hypothetical protein